MRRCWMVLALAASVVLSCRVAAADEPGPTAPLTTVTCRDREDPSAGATLVFDLARGRLLRSSGSGPTILFDDRDIPVRATPATIEWEVAHNAYTLNRVTLELDVIGRVYVCQLAKRQL
jgi:hypothetical protein